MTELQESELQCPVCETRFRSKAVVSTNSLGGSRTDFHERAAGAPTAVEPGLEFVVTATLIVTDVSRSVAFYRDVLGADVLRTGEPTFLRLGNLGLTINVGGGPTDDKPDVIATPPKHQNDLSLFLNLRVTDIERFYERWRSRGASFITEPKTHASELRCYMRDPDGYLIEVGQTTITAEPLELYK